MNSSLFPAETRIWPPIDLVPAPTLTNMSPPLPTVAAPVATMIVPDEPELVVPVENFNKPLTPRVPALLVRTMTDPLDFVVPAPDESEILPPVAVALFPALAVTSPPTFVEDVPTVSSIFPALPPVAEPESNFSKPDAPELVVPVENFKKPLTPFVPASEVFILRSPEVEATPEPVDSEILPPLIVELSPDFIVMSPPIVVPVPTEN